MFKKIFRFVTNEYLLLAIIIITGFIVRLYKIDNPLADWHSFRQADTASVSRLYVENGIKLLFPRYYDVSSIQSGNTNLNGFRFVEFPFYNVIHAIFAKYFPAFSLEVWGRLVSIFFFLFSTVLIFLIGKRFLGKLVGLTAAFFFAFIPYNIYFSRVILPEPMATAFGLAGILFFINFIDRDNKYFLFTSAFSMAVSILIKPFTIFFLIPLLYLLLNKYSPKEIFKEGRLLVNMTLYIAIILIPFFLWRVWINQYPEGIPFFEWMFNGDGIRFRPAFWRWIFGERLGILILGIWGIFPFLAGLVSKVKNYFFQFFFLGEVLYMFVVATANVKHDYYQIFIIPSVSLLLGVGVVTLINSKSVNQLILKPLLIFSIIMMFGASAYKVKEFYKINHPEIIAAGAAVDRLIPKAAKVIAPYNGDTAFLYQTKRFGWPAVDDSFDNLIKKGADFYVSVNLNDMDTKYILGKYAIVEKTVDYLIVDLHQPVKK